MIPFGSLAITVDVEVVVDVAAHAFGVQCWELTSEDRSRSITTYRQVAMAAARLLGHSYPAIGRAFGGRDHSTVIHACHKVAGIPELARKARIIADNAHAPRSLF